MVNLELAAEQDLEQYWNIWISVASRKILPVVSASSWVIKNYLSHLPQTVIELITWLREICEFPCTCTFLGSLSRKLESLTSFRFIFLLLWTEINKIFWGIKTEYIQAHLLSYTILTHLETFRIKPIFSIWLYFTQNLCHSFAQHKKRAGFFSAG